MTHTTPESGRIARFGSDRTDVLRNGSGQGNGNDGEMRDEEGKYRCEVAYDLGDVPRGEREWWLLQITSWLVERGSVNDVAFVRPPDEDAVRIEFGFATATECRRFRHRESHRLVVDGDRVVDSRIERRCGLPE